MGVLAAALGALPTAAAEKTATASVHEIRLRNRTFVPVPVAALSAAAAANDERRRLIVQTEDIPLPARLAVMSGLRAKGARVMHTINSHAAMVSVPAGLDIAQTAGVRWTGSLDPSDKFEGSPGSRLLIEFFPDADDAEIASALSAAGVAPAPRRGLPRHVVYAESSSSGAILALAQAPSVAWILNASSAVVADEVFYYCPGAQGLYGPVADYVKGNDGWDGAGLGFAALTYCYINSTADLSTSTQQAQIKRALDLWSAPVAVDFVPVATAGRARSIDFGFFTGDHGDGSPFDGTGNSPNTLAHANYPDEVGGLSAPHFVHFDDAETWKSGANVDLFSVALHELGHSLGLDHSTNTAAVMYPSYGGVVTGLNQDDVDGIKALYMARNNRPIVGTVGVSAVSAAGAQVVGLVSSSGGSSVAGRGIVFGKSPGPTISGAFLGGGSGTGEFTCSMEGLLEGGTTYYVRAYANNVNGYSYGNEVTVTTLVENDAFSSAILLSGTSVRATAGNVGASVQSGEPNHAGEPGGHSIWWKWVAPADGRVSVDTIGSNFDTLLAVYTGSSVGALTAIASDDQGGGNDTSALTFNAVSGTTYRIAVDGWNGATGSVVLNLSFTSSNTAPAIGSVANQTIAEDGTTGVLSFTIGDAETSASSLTVSGSSSNTTLVPNANIVFGGSGASRTVAIAPAANQSGTTTITITVSDGALTATASFALTVTPVNDAPTISDIADQTINQNSSTSALPFTIADMETPNTNLAVSGSSSNTTLVPNANIVFGGSGANRTVTVTPAPGQSGTATISVTVSDGVLSASDSFLLTVNRTTPNAFSFPPVTGAELNTTYTSDGITVSGINAAAPISVAGGEYSINSGAWITQSGTVNNGAVVKVRRASSGSYSTKVTATITIGGIAGAFDITTKAQPGIPVSINQAAGQADPANTSPLRFTVVFGEAVTGFTEAGVTLSGTASAGAVKTVTGSGTTYTVEVSGLAANGTVLASIPAGAAQNAGGVLNVASTSTDASVTYEGPIPFLPSASQTTLTPLVAGGEFRGRVEIGPLPTGGYGGGWGTPTISGNTITVDAQLTAPGSGVSGQVVTTLINDYSFGALAEGTYQFVFKSRGTVVKSTSLTIVSLAASVAPSGAGTVALDPAGVAGNRYLQGTVVTTTAAPTSGSSFAFQNWSGDASGTTASLTLALNGSKAVTANFADLGPVSVADDFSGSLAMWESMPNDAGATWQTGAGTLSGYYSLSSGSPENTQSFLLLRDEYQPAGNWSASVDFTSVADPTEASFKAATASFGLWGSASSKLSMTIGRSQWNWSPGSLSSIDISVSYWNGSWSSVFERTVSFTWDAAAWNTATLTRVGTVYRLAVNGTILATFTDVFLNGTGRLGLHTYGPKKLDNFRVRPSNLALGHDVVFLSNREGGVYRIWRMHGDGSAPTVLTTAAVNHAKPYPSQEGDRIAYLRTASGGRELRVINADGSGDRLVKLLTGIYDDFMGWMPGDSGLIYRAAPTAGVGVPTLVSLDGATSTVLFQPSVVSGMNDVGMLDFSVNGTCLAWSTQTGSSSPSLEIYTARFGGGALVANTLTRLTQNSASPEEHPVVSPDGNQVAFYRQAELFAPLQLVVKATTGVGATEAVLNGALADAEPNAWSPAPTILLQGRATAGTGNYRIYSVAPDGTALTPLTDATADNIQARWLRVIAPRPEISVQPASFAVASGRAATLSVAAVGSGLSYQWFSGPGAVAPIAGATAASYTTPPLYEPAQYWVRVAQGSVSAESTVAYINIIDALSPLSLSAQNWEPRWWSLNVDQGAWQPGYTEPLTLAATDVAWRQLRSARTFSAGATLLMEVNPALLSGGTNADGFFAGFTSDWIDYAGHFAGVRLSGGKVFVSERKRSGGNTSRIESEIGTYAAGQWMQLALTLGPAGQVTVSGPGWSGKVTASGLVAPVRFAVAVADSTDGVQLRNIGTAAGAFGGLLARYQFEDNAKDGSGFGFDGQASATLTFAGGKMGSAARGNGTTGYIAVPDAGRALNFEAKNDAYTVMLWAKAESVANTGGSHDGTLIIDRATTANTPCSYLLNWSFATGRVQAQCWDGGASNSAINVNSETVLKLGEWHHLALVMGSGALKLYVDGRPEKGPKDHANETDTLPANFGSTRNNEGGSTIGRYAGNYLGNYFPGLLDDVRIYGRALSAPELARIAGGSIVIATQPLARQVSAGSTVTFSVGASAAGQISYQWRKDGEALAGQTGSSLILAGVTAASAGAYQVTVSAPDGVLASERAQLTVGGTAPSFVVRSLPAFYLPGKDLAVTLSATPDAAVQNYAVEDRFPLGWTVKSVGGSGQLDATNRLVKFGPFFDSQPRTLTYIVTAAADATADAGFAGTGSADGLNSGVTGADTVQRGSHHPADNNPVDARLAIAEVTAYGAAWKRGDSWPLAPSPIPIAYVTRAGFLWKGGESYTIDGAASAAGDWDARWWIAEGQAASPGPLLAAAPEAIGAAGTSVRGVSGGTVSVTVSPDSGTGVYAVEESIPAGLAVSAINNSGAFDATNRKVKWGPFFDNTSRVLSYVVAGADGTYAISGTASFDGFNLTTTGAAAVTLGAVNSPVITTSPASVSAAPAGTAVFTVEASGTAPLAFQWRKNGAAIAGATAASFTLNNVQATDAAQYSVIVSNAAGSVTSTNAALSVGAAGNLPVITSAVPATGPIGRAVRINGANFVSAPTVRFNGVQATLLQWAGGTNSYAFTTVPAGATTGPISIQTTDGTVPSGFDFVVTPAPAAPPNDNFANAEPIASATGSVSATNMGASLETGEPAHSLNMDGSSGASGGHSIWYRWVAPAAGAYLFTTQGSSAAFGVMIGVYTGGAVNALSRVVASRFVIGGYPTNVSFNATAGTTYYIAVDGRSGATGDVVLSWSPLAAPLISSLSPTYGTSGTNVLITGTNLGGLTAARFNGVLASSFGSTSGTSTTVAFANVPAGATTGLLTLETAAGSAATSFDFYISSTPPIAPAITSAPQSRTVALGQSAEFAVAASGTPAPRYQWKRNNTAIPGATSATLTIANAQLADAGDYSVTVTNAGGSITTDAVALTVTAAANTVVLAEGDSFDFVARTKGRFTGGDLYVVGLGGGAPAFWGNNRWQRGVVSLGNQGSVAFSTLTPPASGYTVQGVPAVSGHTYVALIGTDAVAQYTLFRVTALTTTSVTVDYEVFGASNLALAVLVQPPAQLKLFAAESDPQPIAATVVGSGVAYQWLKDGTEVPGATRPSLRLAQATPGASGSYRLRASSGADSVLSNACAVQVLPLAAPVITAQPPAYVGALEGSSISAFASFTAVPWPTCSCTKDGQAITGNGIGAAFGDPANPDRGALGISFSNATAAQGGTYVFTLTNGQGSAVAQPVLVEVGAARAPAFAVQPQSRVVSLGAAVTFTGKVTGITTPALQWQVSTDSGNTWADLANDASYSGVTTPSLGIANVTAALAGRRYRCRAQNPSGQVFSEVVSLTVESAVAITVQPSALTVVAEGSPFSLGVSTAGTAPITYQWSRSGSELTGATTAAYSIASARPADTGRYSVTASNTVGGVTRTATSDEAIVAVIPSGTSATHALLGSGYRAGASLTIVNRIVYPGNATVLGWQVLLPAGWSFVSDNVVVSGATHPQAGQTSLLEWTWGTGAVPASPVDFQYVVAVPAGTTGDQQIAATFFLRQGSEPLPVMARPDPLLVPPATTHSADTDRDSRLSLTELTRVIELYNTRNGTVRTGAYKVQDFSEDGFAPDAERLPEAVVTLARYHSADTSGKMLGTPRDAAIGLSELMRVIELYNYRESTVRTGEYHVHPGSEDGFHAGPLSSHPAQ